VGHGIGVTVQFVDTKLIGLFIFKNVKRINDGETKWSRKLINFIRNWEIV